MTLKLGKIKESLQKLWIIRRKFWKMKCAKRRKFWKMWRKFTYSKIIVEISKTNFKNYKKFEKIKIKIQSFINVQNLKKMIKEKE